MKVLLTFWILLLILSCNSPATLSHQYKIRMTADGAIAHAYSQYAYNLKDTVRVASYNGDLTISNIVGDPGIETATILEIIKQP